jgi:hypothetical protein
MGNVHNSAGVYVQERDFSQTPVAATTSIAVLIGEAHQGPVGIPTLVTSESEYISIFGKPDATIGFMGHSAVAFLSEGDRMYALRVAPHALYGGCNIGFDGSFNTSLPFASGVATADDISIAPTDLFAIYAINPGDWNARLYVRVYPDTKFGQGFFYLEVYVTGSSQPVEKWRCHLAYVVDGYGVQLNIEQQINRKSSYIQIVQNHQNAELIATPAKQLINTFDAGGSATSLGISIVGGADGARPNKYDFIQALDSFADPEVIDINMFINGGITDTDYQRAIDDLCRTRMDCIAILDVPSDQQKVTDAIAYRRTDLAVDSSYSALYSSDLLIGDQYNDIRLYVPPSGFVAACYARTDRDYELWFAPAGMTRGDLKVDGVRVVYDQGKRDALYESQVNSIRLIEGSGIKIWGADTLQIIGSSLSNMSVRRLMIFIEKSMENVLLYSVFDPNDQQLRSRLEDAGTRLLRPIKNARGLYNFGVVCDESNNTNESIAAGDLYIDFWLDPVLPVKRVQFTAVINATGVRVTGSNI